MDKTSMILGWLVGRRIAEQRRKKTDIYDDTWPIRWDTSVLLNNSVKSYTADGSDHTPFVKVSNLIPTKLERYTSKFVAIVDGQTREFPLADCADVNDGVEMALYDGGPTVFFIHAANAEWAFSITFPEPGVYFTRLTNDDEAVDCEFMLKSAYEKTEDLPYFLFNGVKIAGLPEFDTTLYSHALIEQLPEDVAQSMDLTSPAYLLLVSSTPATVIDDNFKIVGPAKYWEFLNYGNASYWIPLGENNFSDSSAINISEPVWTNTNIVDAEGTVYFAASDPIPVYDS